MVIRKQMGSFNSPLKSCDEKFYQEYFYFIVHNWIPFLQGVHANHLDDRGFYHVCKAAG